MEACVGFTLGKYNTYQTSVWCILKLLVCDICITIKCLCYDMAVCDNYSNKYIVLSLKITRLGLHSLSFQVVTT